MELIPIKVKTNTEAIEILKEALELVESGEIESLGLAWVLKDRSIGGDISSGKENILMWAALEHVTKSFYDEAIKNQPSIK